MSSALTAEPTDTGIAIFGRGFRKHRNPITEAQVFPQPTEVNLTKTPEL